MTKPETAAMPRDYRHDGTARGMADAMIRYVEDHGGGVSFAEFSSHIPGFNGDVEIGWNFSNTRLWAGMSEVACSAFDLRSAPDSPVEITPTSALVYLMDGGRLPYPIAKGRPPRGGYRTPRWLPIAFNRKSAARIEARR